jgi:amidase
MRLRHARNLSQWWVQGHDILVTPTMPRLPARLGLEPKELNSIYGRFTIPWNFSGQPALSIPIHISASGLPVGVQLVAAYGREDILIRLAAQLERMQSLPCKP